MSRDFYDSFDEIEDDFTLRQRRNFKPDKRQNRRLDRNEDNYQPDKNKRKKKKHGTSKKILITLGIIILAILGILYWKYNYLDANTSVNVETSNSTGLSYTNIALFGLDSREGEMESGVRSDTIIVASIDNLSHKVNMVSILRDNFFKINSEDFNKVNAAFSEGGAKLATQTLNKNLDLDIKNYMVINFTALIKAVDAVGGIDLEMTSDEVYWLNGYQLETAKTCGMESEVEDLPLQDGVQHVNGVQATAYCRVRYVGTDIARTNRQRIVLKALLTAMKKNPLKANSVVDEMFPYIKTNMSYLKFASLGIFMPFYKIEKSEYFPFDRYDTDRVPGFRGSYIIPKSLEANVSKLHNLLFKDNNYNPSDTVTGISDEITDIMGY